MSPKATSKKAKPKKAKADKAPKMKLPTKAELEKMEKDRKESQKKRFIIVQTYTKALLKEFKKSLKAVVVYGSTAKGKHREDSDIDTFVIIDDTKLKTEVPLEVKDKIWGELRVLAEKIDDHITIQAFMFLTEFWESIRNVEPLVMEVVRSGMPVFDTGVFMPAKRMLQRGKLPATKEAVDRRLRTAPQAAKYAKMRVKSAAHHMEQAMANAGQAPLMFIGRVAPAKEDVGKELREHFVKQGLLDEKYADNADKIHQFAKKMEHEGMKSPKDLGAQVDKHLKMLDEFVEKMEELVFSLGHEKKSSILLKTYKTFLKANVGALELKGIKPPEKLEDLPKIVYKNFPQLDKDSMSLFDELARAVVVAKKGKSDVIPEAEVYMLRERTKKFIMNLGMELKSLKDKGKLKLPKDLKKLKKK